MSKVTGIDRLDPTPVIKVVLEGDPIRVVLTSESKEGLKSGMAPATRCCPIVLGLKVLN